MCGADACSAAAVSSVEPSSTTMISQATARGAWIDAMASQTSARRLWVGMMTLTEGMADAHSEDARRNATVAKQLARRAHVTQCVEHDRNAFDPQRNHFVSCPNNR